MRVAVVCYALVLRSAALRDEISRFEPLELEVADEKMHQEALMTPTSPETAANSTADHQPEAFLEVISSANCIDGTLHLRGQNVVNSALVFSKECATLRGDMGAQVTLQEPLIFEGDLRMEGDIRFIAASFFFEPCVEVKGSASMFGNIHFEGCHNKAHNKWHAGGGGLMVKKLTQHAGAIAFHNCSSEDHGAEPQTAEQSGRSLDAKPWSDPPGKRGIALELGPKGERMRVFHATPAMISIILYQVSVSKELTANHSKFRLQLLTEVHSNLAVESLSSCQ
ncbi:unnamed protein product [Cladocopium goreaui]|uniref:Right handed beta helix domain-containing protein n=1 Tax=Cladocopium goreaui TaxID=2562237 RepID=A0A9P1BIQ8_9DINO|nr:unnamed protein product [Cladocopium goreaui]